MDTKEDIQERRVSPTDVEYVPALAVFHCRWCLPDSEELRELLPQRTRERSLLVKINCSARMESELALKALAGGYDGVLVIGCAMGECHYRIGNRLALKRLTLLRDIFSLAGIYPERLGLLWASPFDKDSIRSSVEGFVADLARLGPFKYVMEERTR